jgi:predicted nucleotidyltransferase
MAVTTSIQLSEKVRRRLASLKRDPRETYESVILRCLAAGSASPRSVPDASERDASWNVIAEVKGAVRALYGERFDRLIVFGSVARGEATKDSDIDLMLVLRGPVDVGREIDRIVDQTYPIDLKSGTLTSVVPISLDDFITRTSPLLMNVRREGIVA